MKKLSLITMLLCLALITSCENELEEDQATENVSSSITTDKMSTKTSTAKSAWQNIFWDNFDGFNWSKWSKTNRTDYNSWRCRYLPEQVFIGSWQGDTFLVLRAEKWNSNQWKSGHVKSKQNFRPGNNEELRFKARIKFNAFDNNGWKPFHLTYGAWPAFWTVEENGWPTKGEIDIMEGYTFGQSWNDKYASNLFFGWQQGNNILNSSQSVNYYSNSVNAQGGWNDFEMRWSNQNGWNKVEIYVNNSLKKTYTNNNVSGLRLDQFSAHNIILNLNIGSNDELYLFDNTKNNVFNRTEVLVDYVSVDRRTL
ncbi:glycoside hydrolase family 16 protein [Flavivirga eckloniae]|uniref:Glycoside hydrolase n=1 Tax=Flavivirga eckloniae TaxID=1803846 RepID=A0A2K9PMU6_9FLAO|nr:glycoside hydrolase [Flavivirga eckloniae]AUP78389.1 glycoside hydrolase [Flavivirga eckloniae]